MQAKTQVEFVTHFVLSNPDDTLVLVGSTGELGLWTPDIAPRATKLGLGQHRLSTTLQPGTTYFKWALVNKDGTIIEWEECQNHCLEVPASDNVVIVQALWTKKPRVLDEQCLTLTAMKALNSCVEECEAEVKDMTKISDEEKEWRLRKMSPKACLVGHKYSFRAVAASLSRERASYERSMEAMSEDRCSRPASPINGEIDFQSVAECLSHENAYEDDTKHEVMEAPSDTSEHFFSAKASPVPESDLEINAASLTSEVTTPFASIDSLSKKASPISSKRKSPQGKDTTQQEAPASKDDNVGVKSVSRSFFCTKDTDKLNELLGDIVRKFVEKKQQKEKDGDAEQIDPIETASVERFAKMLELACKQLEESEDGVEKKTSSLDHDSVSSCEREAPLVRPGGIHDHCLGTTQAIMKDSAQELYHSMGRIINRLTLWQEIVAAEKPTVESAKEAIARWRKGLLPFSNSLNYLRNCLSPDGCNTETVKDLLDMWRAGYYLPESRKKTLLALVPQDLSKVGSQERAKAVAAASKSSSKSSQKGKQRFRETVEPEDSDQKDKKVPFPVEKEKKELTYEYLMEAIADRHLWGEGLINKTPGTSTNQANEEQTTFKGYSSTPDVDSDFSLENLTTSRNSPKAMSSNKRGVCEDDVTIPYIDEDFSLGKESQAREERVEDVGYSCAPIDSDYSLGNPESPCHSTKSSPRETGYITMCYSLAPVDSDFSLTDLSAPTSREGYHAPYQPNPKKLRGWGIEGELSLENLAEPCNAPEYLSRPNISSENHACLNDLQNRQQRKKRYAVENDFSLEHLLSATNSPAPSPREEDIGYESTARKNTGWGIIGDFSLENLSETTNDASEPKKPSEKIWAVDNDPAIPYIDEASSTEEAVGAKVMPELALREGKLNIVEYDPNMAVSDIDGFLEDMSVTEVLQIERKLGAMIGEYSYLNAPYIDDALSAPLTEEESSALPGDVNSIAVRMASQLQGDSQIAVAVNETVREEVEQGINWDTILLKPIPKKSSRLLLRTSSCHLSALREEPEERIALGHSQSSPQNHAVNRKMTNHRTYAQNKKRETVCKDADGNETPPTAKGHNCFSGIPGTSSPKSKAAPKKAHDKKICLKAKITKKDLESFDDEKIDAPAWHKKGMEKPLGHTEDMMPWYCTGKSPLSEAEATARQKITELNKREAPSKVLPRPAVKFLSDPINPSNTPGARPGPSHRTETGGQSLTGHNDDCGQAGPHDSGSDTDNSRGHRLFVLATASTSCASGSPPHIILRQGNVQNSPTPSPSPIEDEAGPSNEPINNPSTSDGCSTSLWSAPSFLTNWLKPLQKTEPDYYAALPEQYKNLAYNPTRAAVHPSCLTPIRPSPETQQAMPTIEESPLERTNSRTRALWNKSMAVTSWLKSWQLNKPLPAAERAAINEIQEERRSQMELNNASAISVNLAQSVEDRLIDVAGRPPSCMSGLTATGITGSEDDDGRLVESDTVTNDVVIDIPSHDPRLQQEQVEGGRKPAWKSRVLKTVAVGTTLAAVGATTYMAYNVINDPGTLTEVLQMLDISEHPCTRGEDSAYLRIMRLLGYAEPSECPPPEPTWWDVIRQTVTAYLPDTVREYIPTNWM